MSKGKAYKGKTYLEIITDVVRNQKITSMELFGIEMAQVGFGFKVKEGLEEETGLPAPTEILGVQIQYSES